MIIGWRRGRSDRGTCGFARDEEEARGKGDQERKHSREGKERAGEEEAPGRGEGAALCASRSSRCLGESRHSSAATGGWQRRARGIDVDDVTCYVRASALTSLANIDRERKDERLHAPLPPARTPAPALIRKRCLI